MNRVRKLRKRSRFIRFVLVGLLASLIFRIGYLQVFSGSSMSAKAQNNWEETKAIEPLRGTIYDRNGQKLAYSAPAYYLDVDTSAMEDKEYLTEKISQMSKIPVDVLQKAFS